MPRIININNIIHIIITVILFIDIGYLIKYRKSYLPATFIFLAGILSKVHLYYKEDMKITRRVIISLSIGMFVLLFTIVRIILEK